MALEAYEDAKAEFRNGGLEDSIKQKLWMAIYYGQQMTNHLSPNGQESMIGADIALDSLSRIGQSSSRQDFDIVMRALREYHNLVPAEYNLPLPSGLEAS